VPPRIVAGRARHTAAVAQRLPHAAERVCAVPRARAPAHAGQTLVAVEVGCAAVAGVRVGLRAVLGEAGQCIVVVNRFVVSVFVKIIF
jgi:hypothetical protein